MVQCCVFCQQDKRRQSTHNAFPVSICALPDVRVRARLLKDIGLFDAAGPDGGNSSGNTLSSSDPPGNAAPSGNPGGPNTAAGPAGSSRQTSAEPAAAGASARGTTTASDTAGSSHLPTPPAASQSQQGQQHDPAIMSYLTKVLAFPEADAATALSNTSGNDLAEALDYLCLHTDDSGLKRGFRRGSGGGGGVGVGVGRKGGGGRGGGRKVVGAASAGSSAIEVRDVNRLCACVRVCVCFA